VNFDFTVVLIFVGGAGERTHHKPSTLRCFQPVAELGSGLRGSFTGDTSLT